MTTDPSAEASTNPAVVTDLSDLVTGDAASIRKVLDWVQELDRERRNALTVLSDATHAHKLQPKARAVVIRRASQTARIFAEHLRDENYKTVVSTDTVAWTAPMLEEMADASEKLACDWERGDWRDEVFDRWIAAVKTTWPEVKRLVKLLAAQFEAIRRKAGELPNTAKQGDVQAKSAANLAERNIDQWENLTPSGRKIVLYLLACENQESTIANAMKKFGKTVSSKSDKCTFNRVIQRTNDDLMQYYREYFIERISRTKSIQLVKAT